MLTPADNSSQERALLAQRGELLLDPKYKLVKFGTYMARFNAIVDALEVRNIIRLKFFV